MGLHHRASAQDGQASHGNEGHRHGSQKAQDHGSEERIPLPSGGLGPGNGQGVAPASRGDALNVCQPSDLMPPRPMPFAGAQGLRGAQAIVALNFWHQISTDFWALRSSEAGIT